MKNLQPALIYFLVLMAASACARPLPPPEAAGPGETLALAWTHNAGGAINQTPLLLPDMVLTVPSEGPLLALDLETGKERWRYDPGQGLWERALATDGKRIFAGLKDKSLVALDAANGSLLWVQRLEIQTQVPPLVSGGVVYAVTTFVGPELTPDAQGRARIFAFRAETGDLLWVFETGNYILQTPEKNGDALYVGGNFFDPTPVDEGGHTRIYALNAQDGSLRWTYECEDGFPKRLYATGKMLVFVGYQDFLNGVDAASGQLRWRYDTGNWTPSLLGADGVVYFGSANTLVFALDAETGESLWQFNIPEGSFNYLLGAPVKAGNVLYFLTQQGTLFALEAHSGELLWDLSTPASAARTGPAVAYGWLLIGDIDGNLYAYR